MLGDEVQVTHGDYAGRRFRCTVGPPHREFELLPDTAAVFEGMADALAPLSGGSSTGDVLDALLAVQSVLAAAGFD